MDLPETASDQAVLTELRRLLFKLKRRPQFRRLPTPRQELNPALSVSEYIIAPAGFCETLTINWWRFYTLFVQTYEEYKGSGWTQLNGREKLVHVCVIRQLFLDWEVRAQRAMKPIDAKLGRQTWISFRIFLKAVGRIYRLKSSLPLNIASLQKKNQKRRAQQLIIFARIVLNGRDSLSREDLCKVFVLASAQALPMEVVNLQLQEVLGGDDPASVSIEEFKLRLCFALVLT